MTAPAPQAQVCEACGKPASDFEARQWAGRIRLVCAACRMVAMLERAIKRPKP
jgi:hypothetical protein